MDGEKENAVQLPTGSNGASVHRDPSILMHRAGGQDSSALPVVDGGAADPPGQVPGLLCGGPA